MLPILEEIIIRLYIVYKILYPPFFYIPHIRGKMKSYRTVNNAANLLLFGSADLQQKYIVPWQ